MVLGRRKFGQHGWSSKYSFNTGDLTICASVCQSYLSSNTTVPWDDLRYIFGQITTVRHTSFRHHLEDDPTLGQYPKIVMFAKNGLTSPDMLQKTYIDYISREKTLKESRKKMRSSSYSLVKKVEF